MNARVLATCCLLVTATTVAADERMTKDEVTRLEAACEAAREARIKPLREAEIRKCQADARNDPAWCVRFWADYGNATRLPDGTMSPRMFDDLPQCTQAEAARIQLATQ